MNDTLVTTTETDGIFRITLNRPEARNALSLPMIESLHEAIGLASNSKARVVVLEGAGKSFCAGMDLKGVVEDPAAMGEMLRRLGAATRLLRRLPMPTIARVQGAAIGGGCGLMVVTDLAVTHPEAKLGYPEVNLGICPAVVAPWLIRKIGAGRARAMLLQGGTLNGREGFETGLATHLVEHEELDVTVDQLAAHLCEGGAYALATTKQWLNELDGSLDDAVIDEAAELSARVIAGEEAQSRIRRIFVK